MFAFSSLGAGAAAVCAWGALGSLCGCRCRLLAVCAWELGGSLKAWVLEPLQGAAVCAGAGAWALVLLQAAAAWSFCAGAAAGCMARCALVHIVVFLLSVVYAGLIFASNFQTRRLKR